MNNILAMSNLEAGSFVFVMGLLVVFFGISVIVLVISIIGTVMKKKKEKPVKAQPEQPAEQVQPLVSSSDEDEEARVRAAIVAVLTAYYFNQGSNCEFKIKKIKRL